MLLRIAVEIAVFGIAAVWYAWFVYEWWPWALVYWPLWLLAIACYLVWRDHRRIL